MKKNKYPIILMIHISLILLIYLNSNCKLFRSHELSEKVIKEKLLKKHQVKEDWIKLDLICTFPTKEDEKKGQFFYLPSHMELFDQKFIYVVDSRLHKVFKFFKNGEYLDQFGREGQGPGEFYFPHMIRFSNNRVLFIRDGRGRIQLFNPDGKYIRGFQVYNVIRDFLVADNGFIYSNCVYREAKEENPLIVKFNMNGEKVDSFGERIDKKGHRTHNSEVFLALLMNEIVTVFVHHPLVRRYTLEGRLIKEFRLNFKILNELEKYNHKKWFTNPNPNKIVLPRLIAGVRVLNQRIFVLLQLPRLEILELDKEGNLMNYYYSTAPKSVVSFWGFVVREEKHRLIFYILQSSEEAKLYIFQLKDKSVRRNNIYACYNR